ncbi:hypothetical protein HAX54_025662 [Datura stramonium]|uniref:Uncharacterized protein n=1 Tax=Datura stramonium TaxID=4076 RepID=A0ABS8S6E8_DATST|nr:hypothetical protein [Datura stramonium]
MNSFLQPHLKLVEFTSSHPKASSTKCKCCTTAPFVRSFALAMDPKVAGVMASHADKGKEVAVSKGFKRLREGVALTSSAQKAPPARRFGTKAVEEYGLKWFNSQKEAKYALKN